MTHQGLGFRRFVTTLILEIGNQSPEMAHQGLASRGLASGEGLTTRERALVEFDLLGVQVLDSLVSSVTMIGCLHMGRESLSGVVLRAWAKYLFVVD